MKIDLAEIINDPVSLLQVGIVLSLIVIVLLGWLIRLVTRHHRLQQELERIAAEISAQRSACEFIDRRLGQIQAQAGEDATRLREQVLERIDDLKLMLSGELGDQRTRFVQLLGEAREHAQGAMAEHRTLFEQRHTQALKLLQESLQRGFQVLQKAVGESLLRNSTALGQRMEQLTHSTDQRLREIGGQVDRRLADGFEKTTATFADVVKRLALIDQAQQKITELSSDVVSLQQVLSDKRSRGVFGEVQLNALVRNVMPAAHYAVQHTLPNGKIADCVLFLPEPTGTVAIDAKFPLESYRQITDPDLGQHDRKQAERRFKQDILKHVRDIADKYIIPDTTAAGAVMFIPAEAVFAEIQAHHPDLVEEAHRRGVWMASPTTLWAILNTACAVLKDAATREQIDIIQEHLGYLGKDFQRFRERMDQLARHIGQAHEDVQRVHTSARKISDRFEKIERVEIESAPGSEVET